MRRRRRGRELLARIGGPAPTIRLRLTLLYGVVFLVTGAVLLTIGYFLVRSNLSEHNDVQNELRRLGLAPRQPLFGGPPGPFGRNSAVAREGASIAEAVRAQLRSEALHRLVLEYLVALGAMTMVSVGAGWLLAGRALRPLRDITATARRVSGENLGERIGLVGPADELKELADTFDGMLGRLDAAFASQRHFVANASHELRTPLAIMRTEVDVALADPEPEVRDLRAMGEAVRETIDRCERLIEALLMLARSQATRGREESVDLASLAGDCITDLHRRAQHAGVTIRDDLAPAWVRGEPALLERMIANLVDNGIRHNVPGGALTVRTRSAGERVFLTVANGGARIDPEDARELTAPFRRLDRHGEGFGLGLSIVRSVVEAHGGATRITAPGAGGLEVRIELPVTRRLAKTVGVLQSSPALT